MVYILEYRFGRVKVGEKTYHHDLLVFEEEVLSPWIRREGHLLHPEDLRWLIPRGPRILVIGTGAFGRLQVPEETKTWLTKQGIELIARPTEEAIEEYNRRARTGAEVACGLHLTC